MNADKNKLYDFFADENLSDEKPLSYTKIAYVFLISGALIAYLSLAHYIGNWFLLGAAFFVSGIFIIRKKITALFLFGETEDSDKDTVYELFVSAVNEQVLKRALKTVGAAIDAIDEENIFKIYVPVYENISGINPDNIMRKQTENENFVYSVWQIHILVLSKHSLNYYSCIYNWLENECINEITNEFYFSDIATIKIEIDEKEFNYLNEDELRTETVRNFIITNISGDKIEFIIQKPLLKLDERFLFGTEGLVRKLRLSVRTYRFPEENIRYGDDIDFEIKDTRTPDD